MPQAVISPGLDRLPNVNRVYTLLANKQRSAALANDNYALLLSVLEIIERHGTECKMDICKIAEHMARHWKELRNMVTSASKMYGNILSVTYNQGTDAFIVVQPPNARELLEQQCYDPNVRRLDPLLTGNDATCPKWAPAMLDAMNRDIAELADRYRPTHDNVREVDAILDKIQQAIDTHYPEYKAKVELFGSRVYELCDNSGDIDAAVLCEGSAVLSAEQLMVAMKAIPECKHVFCLPKARAPIAKLEFYDSSRQQVFDCDISCHRNHLGILSTQMIKQYIDMDPRVCYVLAVLKVWGRRRVILSSATLTSFGLLAMGIAFLISRRVVPSLQQVDSAEIDGKSWKSTDALQKNMFKSNSPKLWHSPNTSTSAELIHELFRYYGHVFDPVTQAVSLRLGSPSIPRSQLPGLDSSDCERLLDKPDTWKNTMQLLVIENPIETSVNCASNASPSWVEGFLWEMRRAAWALAPERACSDIGSISRLLLKPTSAIYKSPEAWAPAYKTLLPRLIKSNRKNNLLDPESIWGEHTRAEFEDINTLDM